MEEVSRRHYQPVDHHNEWIIDNILLAHQPPTDEMERVDHPAWPEAAAQGSSHSHRKETISERQRLICWRTEEGRGGPTVSAHKQTSRSFQKVYCNRDWGQPTRSGLTGSLRSTKTPQAPTVWFGRELKDSTQESESEEQDLPLKAMTDSYVHHPFHRASVWCSSVQTPCSD